jgi:hypothetical protein
MAQSVVPPVPRSEVGGAPLRPAVSRRPLVTALHHADQVVVDHRKAHPQALEQPKLGPTQYKAVLIGHALINVEVDK